MDLICAYYHNIYLGWDSVSLCKTEQQPLPLLGEQDSIPLTLLIPVFHGLWLRALWEQGRKRENVSMGTMKFSRLIIMQYTVTSICTFLLMCWKVSSRHQHRVTVAVSVNLRHCFGFSPLAQCITCTSFSCLPWTLPLSYFSCSMHCNWVKWARNPCHPCQSS